jgi:hypothetical protein
MLITPCSPLANVRVSWFKLLHILDIFALLQRDSPDFSPSDPSKILE